MFRYVVLGLLRSGTRLHGYALMKRYRQRTGLPINTGSFYRELQRLVGERLIASAMRGDDTDPRRAPYAITEEGIAAFDSWFTAPMQLGSTSSGEDQLAARMLFLADAPPDVAARVLTVWQDALWNRAKAIDHAREAALGEQGATAGFEVLPYLLARRLRHVAADIELIDELRRAYDAWSTSQRVPIEPVAASASAAGRTSDAIPPRLRHRSA
jgi:DNA-binding PadR family transcriptional regulator